MAKFETMNAWVIQGNDGQLWCGDGEGAPFLYTIEEALDFARIRFFESDHESPVTPPASVRLIPVTVTRNEDEYDVVVSLQKSDEPGA